MTKFVAKPLKETADASRGLVSRRTLWKDVVAVIIFFAAAYLILGWLGLLVAAKIPDGWEKKMSVLPELLDRPEAADELTRVQGIMDRLTEGEELRDLDYRLFILDFKDPNAVAVPGGGIGVTVSLLKKVDTEIGLAFVLAHELGHHQHRHVLRAMGRSLPLHATASMFGHAGSALDSALSVSDNRFSRAQERHADEFAIRLIQKQYGTTEGALQFFEVMQAVGDEYEVQKYFGSHPMTKERIEQLEARARELAL